MPGFTLYPAIDIRGGRCVRLVQGDYARETDYGDPAEMAVRWSEAGAAWLHVVDLDGARDGRPANLPAIEAILAEVSIPVQVGGGLRRREDVEALLERGATRVVLGTAAVEEPRVLAQLVRGIGERVTVGVDLREGRPQVRGWREAGTLTLEQLLRALEEVGIRRIIHTEISRDGMLAGFDVAALRRVLELTDMSVIASGGVSSLEDVRAIKKLMPLGVEGAILGKALYTGALELGKALALQEV